MEDIDEVCWRRKRETDLEIEDARRVVGALVTNIVEDFIRKADFYSCLDMMKMSFRFDARLNESNDFQVSRTRSSVHERWKKPNLFSLLVNEFERIGLGWIVSQSTFFLVVRYDPLAFVRRGGWAILRTNLPVSDDVLRRVVSFVTRFA